MRMMPDRPSSRSNSGTVLKNSSSVRFSAKAHQSLNPSAIIPAAVEQNDLTGARKLRDVALETPLGTLPLGRRCQYHRSTDARVKRSSHSPDRAAPARCIAALKQHDDFEFFAQHTVLELHELVLQSQHFLEIKAAVERFLPWGADALLGRPTVVVEFRPL
jgi:hypothetical protein